MKWQKEIKKVPGVAHKTYGLSHKRSATELWHTLTTTHHSLSLSPFYYTRLLLSLDINDPDRSLDLGDPCPSSLPMQGSLADITNQRFSLKYLTFWQLAAVTSGISKKTFGWWFLQENPEWCNPAGQASSTSLPILWSCSNPSISQHTEQSTCVSNVSQTG